MTRPTDQPSDEPAIHSERAPLPDERPVQRQPPPSGCCRVWLHTPGLLRPLGDYPNASPRDAAVAAFDQVEGRRRRTYLVQDADGFLTAWTVSSDRRAE